MIPNGRRVGSTACTTALMVPSPPATTTAPSLRTAASAAFLATVASSLGVVDQDELVRSMRLGQDGLDLLPGLVRVFRARACVADDVERRVGRKIRGGGHGLGVHRLRISPVQCAIRRRSSHNWTFYGQRCRPRPASASSSNSTKSVQHETLRGQAARKVRPEALFHQDARARPRRSLGPAGPAAVHRAETRGPAAAL